MKDRLLNASKNKVYLLVNYTVFRFLLSTLCNARFRFHFLNANFLPFSFSLSACLFFLFNIFSVAFQTFLLANALELKNSSEIILLYLLRNRITIRERNQTYQSTPGIFELRVFFFFNSSVKVTKSVLFLLRLGENKLLDNLKAIQMRGERLISCQCILVNIKSFL